MTSKTPQFDRALDAYFFQRKLDEHGGQWRTCRFSNEKFYIRPEDVEFYKKIRVPLPTLSPLERSRRRMAFVPSYNFYRIQSAKTNKTIISTYPPGNPFQKTCATRNTIFTTNNSLKKTMKSGCKK